MEQQSKMPEFKMPFGSPQQTQQLNVESGEKKKGLLGLGVLGMGGGKSRRLRKSKRSSQRKSARRSRSRSRRR
jgi:hypothetical protein